MQQKHTIIADTVQNPINYQDLAFELNFDNDTAQRSASITRFEWHGKTAQLLKDIFNKGIVGGEGLFFGVPHKIEILENGLTELMLDGYIDLTTAEFFRDKVIADTIPRNQLDWLTEHADGFTFEFLYKETNELGKVDIQFVPYTLNSIPDYTQSFLVILSLTFVVLELKRAISDLTEATAKTAGYISSVSGIIQLVFKIIFVILLMVTLVELILDLAALIIQKVKYKASMSVNRQIEAACSHLGITYKSSILQSPEFINSHIIPETFSNISAQSDSRIKGWFKGDTDEQSGYFRGTFGDLLRALKDMFHARIVMNNGVLSIEPVLKTGNSATFKITNHYNRAFRTNADQVVSTNVLSFRYDTSDANTIDSWEGNNVQETLEPVNKGNAQLRLMKGYQNIQLPFARGIRKTELNTVESIIDDIFDSIDPVIGAVIKLGNGGIKVINAILELINDLNDKLSIIGIEIELGLEPVEEIEDPNLAELLDGRIGMLQLQNDFFTVPKFVILKLNDDDNKVKIDKTSQTYINAAYLWENFHTSKSFAPSATSAQRILKTYEKVEMNLTEFKQVMEEGLCKLPDGNIADVSSCKWNPSNRLATFEVQVRQLYTNNLRSTLQIPSGR